MHGTLVRRVWQHDPAVYAPPRHRRGCAYDAFVPDPITGIDVALSGDALASMSEADAAIRQLNSRAEPALAPFARLLLRTESIASSKVEGLQVDPRDLARAEARVETGGKAGPTAREVLANIDAMELAIDEASSASRVTVTDIVEIHRALLASAPNSQLAGQVRSTQNWIGGNDYNPCAASFVPPPPEHVQPLLDDLCEAVNEDDLPPIVQAA
jgi:Fic family protein